MPSAHATESRYVQGCRCDDCRDAHATYQRNYQERRAAGLIRGVDSADFPQQTGSGRVESAVKAELEGLALAVERPGLVETALELARLMDDPRAKNQKPAAAAKLAELLDKLRKGADARKSKLASVRSMTSAKSATG